VETVERADSESVVWPSVRRAGAEAGRPQPPASSATMIKKAVRMEVVP
jgi:hypothetical protein